MAQQHLLFAKNKRFALHFSHTKESIYSEMVLHLLSAGRVDSNQSEQEDLFQHDSYVKKTKFKSRLLPKTKGLPNCLFFKSLAVKASP